MKIHKQETVVRYRYCLTFDPRETRILREHPAWRPVVSIRSSVRNGRKQHVGAATLTKKQIGGVCDVLGVNGREYMAAYEAKRKTATP